MRGQVSTPSAAPRSARTRTGSTRRSAQSYCCDSRASPAKMPEQPRTGQEDRRHTRQQQDPAEGLEHQALGGSAPGNGHQLYSQRVFEVK